MTSSSDNTAVAFSFWHPASLLATFFGIGKIPFAPGTFGSLAAFPLLYGVGTFIISLPIIKNDYDVFSRLMTLLGILLLLSALLFIAGVWASAEYSKHTSKEDPGEIVIDEVVGQSLTFLLIFPSVFMVGNMIVMFMVAVAGSFILFRFCDIKKPWPIDWCDSHIKGGIGVMFDDIVAAIMAVVFYYILMFLSFDILSGFNINVQLATH